MIKLLKYYAIFAIVYISLVILTMPLFISWASNRKFIEKAYIYFIGSPFDYSKSLWLIFVNSLFWFLLLYVLIYFKRMLIKK